MLPHLISEVRVEGRVGSLKAPGKFVGYGLEPIGPPAYPEAIQAILSADLIITGPGSLYTSILTQFTRP